MILIPVVSAGSEVTFLRISGPSVAIPHPLPRTPSQQACGICSSLPLVSILVNCRQPILCSRSPALLTNRDPNKFLCCYRIFFLPHLHCLVLHHVEGNYTFIYYIASNIKPRKLYQRQQLFNHPSRETRFQRQSPFCIPKVITHSRKPISKASFICGYC